MTLKTKIAAAAAVALLIVGIVYAQTQATTPQDRMQHHLQFVANYLNLTDAQKQAAQAILQDAHTQAEPILTQLKTGHQDIAAAVKAGKSDAELTAIATAQGNLMGQLAAIHAKAMSKVYALLTPDQKTKADQLHEHFQSMMQNQAGPGMMMQHFGAMMHHSQQ